MASIVFFVLGWNVGKNVYWDSCFGVVLKRHVGVGMSVSYYFLKSRG